MTTATNECNSKLCTILAAALNKACGTSGENGWRVTVATDVAPSDQNPPVCDHITVSGELSGILEYEIAQADLDQIGAAMASKDPRGMGSALRDELVSVLSKKFKNVKAELEVADKLDASTSKSITLAATRTSTTPLTFKVTLSPTLYEALANISQPATKPASQNESNKLNLVMDVELNVMLRFGQRQMALSDILDLKMGSVVELDRKVEEPVELLLDGTVFARGEAVIIDGNYGLRITEVLQPMASQFVN